MKKNYLLALLAGSIILLAASCASAPAEKQDPANDLSLFRTSAGESREKALQMKANVAVPQLFKEADSALTQAKEQETAKDTEAALTSYKNATALFTKAYDEAKSKKDAALKALETTEIERKSAEDAIKAMEEEEKGGQK